MSNKTKKNMFDSFISIVINELTKKEVHHLTGASIRKKFEEFSLRYSVDIPYTSRDQKEKMISKSDVFYKNIQCFSNEQKFSIIKDFLEIPEMSEEQKIKELKNELITKFGSYAPISVNLKDISQKIDETQLWLKDYPEALKQYKSALEKLNTDSYTRNALDDLRLCLELFLKEYLNNDKSLENQKSEIGKCLKKENISKELRNMFSSLFDYYVKYQNNNVKHNVKYNSNETYFIFELTTVFLRFLVKLKKV